MINNGNNKIKKLRSPAQVAKLKNIALSALHHSAYVVLGIKYKITRHLQCDARLRETVITEDGSPAAL